QGRCGAGVDLHAEPIGGERIAAAETIANRCVSYLCALGGAWQPVRRPLPCCTHGGWSHFSATRVPGRRVRRGVGSFRRRGRGAVAAASVGGGSSSWLLPRRRCAWGRVTHARSPRPQVRLFRRLPMVPTAAQETWSEVLD